MKKNWLWVAGGGLVIVAILFAFLGGGEEGTEPEERDGGTAEGIEKSPTGGRSFTEGSRGSEHRSVSGASVSSPSGSRTTSSGEKAGEGKTAGESEKGMKIEWKLPPKPDEKPKPKVEPESPKAEPKGVPSGSTIW
ncbi:MAG: hypothetical protein N2234_06570 [Planctomycetota bacterium]|nr:hypothetical protein [Planctomycetota bacterium]